MPTYDWVYRWGVAHHIGNPKLAIELLKDKVSPGGRLVLALYNDQGWKSAIWRLEKRFYSSSSKWNKGVHEEIAALYFTYLRNLVRTIRGMIIGPPRGMELRVNLRDWIGGYPFEVASVNQVLFWFFHDEWTLVKVIDVGTRNGCNEFIFQRSTWFLKLTKFVSSMNCA